jgi:RNA recognition motif-containing protein
MKIIKKKQITRGIFIKNVSYCADINTIEAFLSKYSIIYNDIIMFHDKLNNFKGRIIIILNNEEAATDAIKKLNNLMFLNRKLKVTYVYNKYINNSNCNDIINLLNNKLNLI